MTHTYNAYWQQPKPFKLPVIFIMDDIISKSQVGRNKELKINTDYQINSQHMPFKNFFLEVKFVETSGVSLTPKSWTSLNWQKILFYIRAWLQNYFNI